MSYSVGVISPFVLILNIENARKSLQWQNQTQCTKVIWKYDGGIGIREVTKKEREKQQKVMLGVSQAQITGKRKHGKG